LAWATITSVQIAYIDESGDSGQERGSKTYTLGCVLIRDTSWPDTFDGMLGFRRYLRSQFGIRLREEIKANFLLRGGGDLKRYGFGEKIRHDLYRSHMRIAAKLGIKAFAVVIDKPKIYSWRDPRTIAWEFTLQRLERLSTKSGEPVLIMHDEGDSVAIRGLVRKARRSNTAGSAEWMNPGSFRLPARLILDDAVPRDSSQSYFIQLADLCAYAAFRTVYAPGRASVCPGSMWNELGGARLTEANQLAGSFGSAPGVVVWPK